MDKKVIGKWIWYYGDMEVWLRTQVERRRKQRGMTHPPVWKLDSFYHSIKFRKFVNLEVEETIKLYVEGEYYVKIDEVFTIVENDTIKLSKGKHEIVIFVINEMSVPSILVDGDTIISDETWDVSYYAGGWKKAGTWSSTNPYELPSKFHLPTKEVYPTSVIKSNNSIFIDFGKETFGFLKLINTMGKGNVAIYYGESKEEALAGDIAETFDKFKVDNECKQDIILEHSKVFRYINIVHDMNIDIENISTLSEYLPVDYKGNFKCSNDLLNKIWDTAVYTLQLNTREFYLDGLKRDRWLWGGDALQSFLMNYYTFFDKDINRRTLIALRGKEPVESHINTIMDYTFYWFISLYDYYMYTGDYEFIEKNYDKMNSLMKFCLNRRNENEMMEGIEEDWIFIDWADMDKSGELCSEQILLLRSLEIMSIFAGLLCDDIKSNEYKILYRELKSKILNIFWDNNSGGFINNRVNGVLSNNITKHPSLLAIFTGLLDTEKIEQAKEKIILNNAMPKITTPYFRFFELDALCRIGEQEYVTKEILDYWGGMINIGATTFWEEFNPELKDSEHYEMYGRPFGKSLCHAWGASPVYLLGKYYLGVSPLTSGYETYIIEPSLGGLEWIEGSVPINNGIVNIYMNIEEIKIQSTEGKGYLRFKSYLNPSTNMGKIKVVEENYYELEIDPDINYSIKY